MTPEIFVIIMIAAFVAQFFDVALGMGYGTLMVPILILLGVEPVQAVSLVLITNALFGILAVLVHVEHNNLHLRDRGTFQSLIIFSITAVLGSVLGTFIAVNFKSLFNEWIPHFSSFLLLFGGLLVYHMYNTSRETVIHNISSAVRVIFYKPNEEQRKYIFLGFFASVIKVLIGSYGPMMMAGQIFFGINTHRAVSATIFAEMVATFAGGILTLFAFHVDSTYLIPILIGGMFSVSTAAFVVGKVSDAKLKLSVALFMVALGILAFGRAMFG